ncbi:hypothetical protein CAP48_08210 [Advenella sp. S44]|uniref:cytochrome d ubiquinol oxidase subunit II n=1 Tax=Advenella sp. S44 TaxID=1982755 RepID=UPI000C29AF6D|nr:cytochrome d ubiquinol oxidase subunit II [Advenella sp. S44]PJX25996.1 hypothetical protein CAP48_08210 [Advenella sp. S44]
MIDTLAGSLGLNSYDPGFWMPLLCFTVFLGVSVAGAILDGVDLGVGMLMPFAQPEQRDRMFTFLGPWRDMNVFWIFLGCAILLSAFPKAWAYVSSVLYLPLMLLAAGALLRGVSYEFRLRALAGGRTVFAAAFALGSLMTAFGQGLVLGRIAVNFGTEPGSELFAVFIAFCTVAAFILLGAAWLLMRVEDDLQLQARGWVRRAARLTAAGVVAVSVALGMVNGGVFFKWTESARMPVVLTYWFALLVMFVIIELVVRKVQRARILIWLPFILTVLIVMSVLAGLVFSVFPFFVLDELTIWESVTGLGTTRVLVAAFAFFLVVLPLVTLWYYRDMLGKERKARDVLFMKRMD